MIQLKQVIGAWLLASVLLPTTAAHADEYYVATTGSDSHPGTEKKPWRTVAHAVTTMVAGDTTYVKGGTYDEKAIRFGRSGTQSAPIKLLNYRSEHPIIRCINPAKDFMRVEHLSGLKNPVGWITIEGFEITNCLTGLKYYNLHDSTIRRNWIHHNPQGAGILGVGGTRILIERNVINSNGKVIKSNHGIYANGTDYIIVNNVIYDSWNWGIQLNSSCGNKACYNPVWHAGPEFARSDNWVIANNTFAYNRNRSAIVSYGSEQNGTRIENNIFYENCVTCSSSAANAIEFYNSKPTGVTIRNNLSYASGSGGTAFITAGLAVEDVNYTQSGNIVNVSNPGFVNAPATLPSTPNFALTERSPAIDKGLSPSDETRSETRYTAFDDALFAARVTDFAGTARPKGRGYDIGAYEYTASGDAQSPAAPILKVE